MALVTVAACRDVVDAELIRVHLESEGIPAYVVDQYLVGMQWLYSAAIGGVKVQVAAADAPAARELLGQGATSEGATTDSSVERCPNCGSTEIGRSRVQRVAGAASLLVSLPIILWRRAWVCRACSHSWRRSGWPTTPPETDQAEIAVRERHSYPAFRNALLLLVGLGLILFIGHRIQSGF